MDKAQKLAGPFLSGLIRFCLAGQTQYSKVGADAEQEKTEE